MPGPDTEEDRESKDSDLGECQEISTSTVRAFLSVPVEKHAEQDDVGEGKLCGHHDVTNLDQERLLLMMPLLLYRMLILEGLL
jgi:hypothetical protein